MNLFKFSLFLGYNVNCREGLSLIWDEMVFCAIDTETTGIDPLKGDRIIEMAIVPVFRGRIILEKAFHSLVNPRVGIPALVQKIHGISNSEVMEAPPMEEVFPILRNFIKGTILVLHNAHFDLTFLDFAAKDIGEFPLTVSFIDTQDMTKVIFGRGHTLKWLAKRFGIKDEITHRALDDAIVTAKVFIKLSKIIGYSNVEEFIRRWG